MVDINNYNKYKIISLEIKNIGRLMSTLNDVFDLIEDLSFDEKFAIYDFLRNKLSSRLEEIYIAEYKHVQKQFAEGKVEPETVEDMFDRLGI